MAHMFKQDDDRLGLSNPEEYLHFVKQHLGDLSTSRNLPRAQRQVLEAINNRCHGTIQLVETRLNVLRTSLLDARSECHGSYLQKQEIVRSQLKFFNKLGSKRDPFPSFIANWPAIQDSAVKIEQWATKKDAESRKQSQKKPLEQRHAMDVARMYSTSPVNEELECFQDLERARKLILRADLEEIPKSVAGRSLAAIEVWSNTFEALLDSTFSTAYDNEIEFERTRDLLAVIRHYPTSRTEVVEGRVEMLPQFEAEHLLSLWLRMEEWNDIHEAHQHPLKTDPFLLPPANYRESLPFFAKMHRVFTGSHLSQTHAASIAPQHSLRHHHRRFTSRQVGIYRLGI
ncbi:hypothetical protein JCM5350_003023 [Sporobolomyces pararoseus]